MKKNQLLKLCFRWMPTSAMMLCTMTMLTAGPLLPKASAAIEQNAKPTQVTGMVTDGEKQPLIGVTITLVGTDVHALTELHRFPKETGECERSEIAECCAR